MGRDNNSPAKAEVPATCRMLDWMATAGPAELAEIDQEIATLRQEIEEAVRIKQCRLESLVALRKFVDVRVNGKKPRVTKDPRPAARLDGALGRPAAPDDAKRAIQTARRVAAAKLLAKDAPLGSSVIANRCDIPVGSVTSVLQCPWFEATSQGYTLTTTGRREAGV